MDLLGSTEFWIYAVLGLLALYIIVLVLIKPRLGIVLTIAYLAYRGGSTAGVTLDEIMFVTVLLLSVVSSFTRDVLSKDQGISPTTFALPIFLFLGYDVLSIGISLTHNVSLLDWARYSSKFIGLLLFFPIVREFTTEKQLRMLLALVIASGVIVGFQGLYNNFRYGGTGGVGILGTTHKGSTLFYWSLLLLLAILGYIEERRYRALLLIAFLLLVFRALIDFRREPLIVFAVGASLIMFHMVYSIREMVSGLAWRRLVLGLLVIFGSFLLVGSLWSELVTTWYGLFSERITYFSYAKAYFGRAALVRAGFDLFLEQPIFGWGPGYNWGESIPAYVPFIGRMTFVSDVHNFYVQLLYRHGVVGAGLYLWFLAKLLKENVRLVRDLPEGFWRGVARGLLACLIPIGIILMMFDVRGIRVDLQAFLGISAAIVTQLQAMIRADTTTQEIFVESTDRICGLSSTPVRVPE